MSLKDLQHHLINWAELVSGAGARTKKKREQERQRKEQKVGQEKTVRTKGGSGRTGMVRTNEPWKNKGRKKLFKMNKKGELETKGTKLGRKQNAGRGNSFSNLRTGEAGNESGRNEMEGANIPAVTLKENRRPSRAAQGHENSVCAHPPHTHKFVFVSFISVA